MIIDIHTHCFPDKLAQETIPMLAERADVDPYLPGTVSALQESMEQADLDYSVLQNIATRPEQTEKINDWAIKVQQNRKGILAFGTIHPEYSSFKQELDRIKKQGIKGIKFHPDYQEFFVEQEEYFPLYEAVFERDLIVLFHCGEDIGLPEPQHCTPTRLARVVENFPGADIIAAHMGGYHYWDEVEKELVGRDIWFDTSYSQKFMSRQQFSRMIKQHGIDKILFGTDSPWAGQKEELNRINTLSLTETERKKILGQNAARLLNIVQ